MDLSLEKKSEIPEIQGGWKLQSGSGEWPVDERDLSEVILSVPQIDRLAAQAGSAPSVQVVPEPGTWLLIGVGSAFLLWRVRRFAR